MIKKIRPLVLIMIFLLTLTPSKYIKADEIFTTGGGIDDRGEKCEAPSGNGITITNTEKSTIYEISSNLISYKIGTKWNGYDINNNKLDSVISGTKFLADLEEYKNETYKCSVATQRTTWEYKYDCTKRYHLKEVCDFELPSGICLITRWISDSSNYTVSCKTGTKSCITGTRGCNTAELKSQANSKSKVKIEPSYTVTIPDPNDYYCETEKCNPIEITNPQKYTPPPIINKSNSTFIISTELLYEMNKTCINVKTGKIRYLSDNGNCNSDEYEVSKTNASQWNIFIPLNMKTGDKFIIEITPKNNKGAKTNVSLSAESCKVYIQEHKETYMEDLKPQSGTFKGNYVADLNVANNGCTLIGIKLVITANQRFYNEEKIKDDIKFRGFSFTYRPIDINNPFPNVNKGNIDSEFKKTITNADGSKTELESYWYDWYQSSKKDPNISTSFEGEKISYISSNMKSKIMKNIEIPLTDWRDSMNVDGSMNISSNGLAALNGIITKYNTGTYYKLGCGPLNSNSKNPDGSTNLLYQKECGDLKT